VPKLLTESIAHVKLTRVHIFRIISGTTPGTCSPPTEEEDAAVLRARLDAECQQLARDLQAAVQELVKPELNLPKNNKGPKNRVGNENHDYSEIYTPSSEKRDGLATKHAYPPVPPVHR